MARLRTLRPIKRPVFLAGEGPSERGYCRWLNRLAAQAGIAVAIQAESLTGGDPLDLVDQAFRKIARIERQRGPFKVRGLLLDSDRRGQDRDRDEEAAKRSRKGALTMIWQEPIHEAFLFRHFEGFQDHRPVDNAIAERRLRKIWPEYSKGMDADGYGGKLTLANLNMARSVEPILDRFLNEAGWPC